MAEDITFSQWLKIGRKYGYCSEQFCFTHDPAPMHESEETAWEEGYDPCCHVVRLGEPKDWEVTA